MSKLRMEKLEQGEFTAIIPVNWEELLQECPDVDLSDVTFDYKHRNFLAGKRIDFSMYTEPLENGLNCEDNVYGLDWHLSILEDIDGLDNDSEDE